MTTAIFNCIYIYALSAVISLALAGMIKGIVFGLTRGGSSEQP